MFKKKHHFFQNLFEFYSLSKNMYQIFFFFISYMKNTS